jgi:hypothetical protein
MNGEDGRGEQEKKDMIVSFQTISHKPNPLSPFSLLCFEIEASRMVSYQVKSILLPDHSDNNNPRKST